MPETDSNEPRRPSLKQQRRPLVAITVTLLSCFFLLLAGVQGWNAWRTYGGELEDSRVATANMARALATHAETSIKLGDAMLGEMVERIERDGLEGSARARIRSRMQAITHDVNELHGLFVYGPDGKWIASSLPQAVQGNNFDREYFQFHLLHPGRGMHIGTPVRSRSTGVWILPLSRRLDKPDGSFAGVVLATLDLAWFGRFYDSFDVGQTGTIILALDNGTLIYRRPFVSSQVGTDIRSGPVWQLYKKNGPVGSAVLKARLDHVERLYSYRHLDAYPLLVASAQAKDEILAEWRASTVKSGLLLLAAAAVLFGGGVVMVRQIRLRDCLERELRQAGVALRRHNASLKDLADSDGLTGLANRRLFEDHLMREYERARRTGAPFALIMADVDYFKKYNDRFGHVAGDECLRKVAAAIATAARRPPDLAARYGGEEFAVILPDADLEGAQCVAEQIRAAVAALALRHPDNAAGHVTLSMGLYVDRPAAVARSQPLGWVEAADRLLYEAKANGRDRVVARAGQAATA